MRRSASTVSSPRASAKVIHTRLRWHRTWCWSPAGFSWPAGRCLHFAPARYGLGGVLDGEFSGDGKLTTDLGYSESASSIAVQPDGRIVVGGDAYYTDGNLYSENYGAVARYLVSDGPPDADADGVLDSGYSPPSGLRPGTERWLPPFPAIHLAVLVPERPIPRVRRRGGRTLGLHGGIPREDLPTQARRPNGEGGRRDRLLRPPLRRELLDSDSAHSWPLSREVEARATNPDVGWCSGARSAVLRLPRK